MIATRIKLKELFLELSKKALKPSELEGFNDIDLFTLIKNKKKINIPLSSFKEFLEYVYKQNNYTLKNIPYLLKMYELMASSKSEIFVFKKPSQIGATTFFTTLFIYYFLKYKLPVLYVAIDAPKILIIRTELVKYLEAIGINVLIKEKNFLLTSEGMIYFAYTTSAETFRGIACAIVFIDEVGGMPNNIGGEGDVLSLVLARTTTYSHFRKIFMFSTPTDDVSVLEKYFEMAGTYYNYMIKCNKCGHEFEPSISDIGLNGTVFIRCRNCKESVDILLSSNDGHWLRIEKDGDKNIVAFKMNLLSSPLASLKDIYFRYENSLNDGMALRAFYNLVLADEYKLAESIFPKPVISSVDGTGADVLYSCDLHRTDVHVLRVLYKNGFVIIDDGFVYSHPEFLDWLEDKSNVIIDVGFLSGADINNLDNSILKKLIPVRGSNNNSIMGRYVQYAKLKRGAGAMYYVYRQDVFIKLYQLGAENKIILNEQASEYLQKSLMTAYSRLQMTSKGGGQYRWYVPDEFHEYTHFLDCLIYNIAIYETFKNKVDFSKYLKTDIKIDGLHNKDKKIDIDKNKNLDYNSIGTMQAEKPKQPARLKLTII